MSLAERWCREHFDGAKYLMSHSTNVFLRVPLTQGVRGILKMKS